MLKPICSNNCSQKFLEAAPAVALMVAACALIFIASAASKGMSPFSRIPLAGRIALGSAGVVCVGASTFFLMKICSKKPAQPQPASWPYAYDVPTFVSSISDVTQISKKA